MCKFAAWDVEADVMTEEDVGACEGIEANMLRSS